MGKSSAAFQNRLAILERILEKKDRVLLLSADLTTAFVCRRESSEQESSYVLEQLPGPYHESCDFLSLEATEDFDSGTVGMLISSAWRFGSTGNLEKAVEFAGIRRSHEGITLYCPSEGIGSPDYEPDLSSLFVQLTEAENQGLQDQALDRLGRTRPT